MCIMYIYTYKYRLKLCTDSHNNESGLYPATSVVMLLEKQSKSNAVARSQLKTRPPLSQVAVATKNSHVTESRTTFLSIVALLWRILIGISPPPSPGHRELCCRLQAESKERMA